jgi:hypothetical protein
VIFTDLFIVSISAKTLSNMDLELDNQVGVMESHQRLWNMVRW